MVSLSAIQSKYNDHNDSVWNRRKSMKKEYKSGDELDAWERSLNAESVAKLGFKAIAFDPTHDYKTNTIPNTNVGDVVFFLCNGRVTAIEYVSYDWASEMMVCNRAPEIGGVVRINVYRNLLYR